MGAIKLDNFTGMVPTRDTLLLPVNAAEDCADAWLTDGTLQGWREPVEVYDLKKSSTKVVYRIPNQPEIGRAADYFDSTWLEFDDADTDVVRGPVAEDRYGRFYWTSPSTPPRYNTTDRILTGQPSLVLGVPSPEQALDVDAPDVVGDAPPLIRSYLFTYVTAYGEEGPPSPPITRTGNQIGTWALAFPPIPAAVKSGRQIAKRRIYRTVTGSSGTADFFLVGEYDVSIGTVADTFDDVAIAGATALASHAWTPPPALQGLIALPNGVLAGWIGREVWFSEPFRPHAWPGKYAVSIASEIVGLGVSGAGLYVLTTSHPVLISGAHPSSARADTLQTLEPCLSRHSIVSTADGVFYAAPSGLMSVSGGLVFPSTFQLAQRRDWLREVNAYAFRSVRIGTTYFAVTSSGKGVMIDLTAGRAMFSLISTKAGWQSIQRDPWSGDGLLIKGGKVFSMDAKGDGAVLPYRWRSKLIQISKRDNMGAAKVFFRTRPDLPYPAAEVESPTELSSTMWGIVRLFTSLDNGQTVKLVASRELRKSGALLRLPSGFKSEFWQIEVEARVEITGIQFASTARELAAV